MKHHLALQSNLELETFCKVFSSLNDLPPFRFDFENETEWGEVELNGIWYNVSRPYEAGTLHAWDATVPSDCNFGITLGTQKKLSFSEVFKNEFAALTSRIAQKLAVKLNTTVYHHRTWLNPDQSIDPKHVYHPSRVG